MRAKHRNSRQGSVTVAAAGRRGGGRGGSGGGKRKSAKKAQADEAAAFEQLMIDWDDAFAADCADTRKAATMARLAQEGHAQHGRGFVFVRSRLERVSRKAAASGSGSGGGKGFGSAPAPAEKGTPLPNNPQLRLLEWRATFIPGSQLDALGSGAFSAAGGGAALLPDAGGLLASSSSSGGKAGGDDAPGEVLDQLYRVLRGQDLSQLRAYIGLPPAPPPGSHSSGGSASDAASSSGSEGPADGGAAAAAEDEDDSGMMGIRRYEPEAGELVVLLAARIGSKPATGAELLVAARGEDGSTTLNMPDGWEEALAMA